MGIREIMQKRKAEYLKQRAETKGYRKLVAEKTKLARRQAYADEAVKVAREQARAKARQPSFGQRLGSFAQRVSQPKPVTKMRTRTPMTKMKTKRTTTRKRRMVQRTVPIQQAPRQTTPANLNQAIYGGY
jgi:hypothetical protein